MAIDYEKLVEAQKKYLELQTEIEEATGKTYSAQEKQNAEEIAALQQKQQLLRDTYSDTDQLLSQAIKLQEKAQTSLDLSIQERDLILKRAELLQDLAYAKDKNDKAEIERLQEKLKKEINITQEKRKQRDLDEKNQKNLDKSVGKFAALLGFGTKFEDTMTGAFTNILTSSASLSESLKKIDLAGFLASNLEQLATGMFDATAGFISATGATGGLAASVREGADSLRMMGLGFQDAFNAARTLTKEVTAFQTGTAQAREELVVFFGVLEKAGISGTGPFQTFNKSLGLTVEQSMAATEGLIQFGRALNVDVNTFITEFNQLAPELIAHGDNMDQVFKELAVTSQQTGLAMGNLMGVAQQFDTFEGAAQATAKLNSILGGAYLNSVEMVYATESERLETLHETLALSGKSFDDLGRFEKKALATAGGFKSVGDAAAFFNTSLEVNAARAEAQAEKQETMAELARQTSTIMERLSLTMQQLFISMEPVVRTFSLLIDGLSTILSSGIGVAFTIGLLITKIVQMGRSLNVLSTIWKKSPFGLVFGGAALLAGLFGGSDSDSGGEPQGFQSGLRMGDAAGPDLGGGMTVARVHQGETIAMPRRGAAIHNAAQSAQFATKSDMNNIAAAITNGLASVSSNNGGNIILDGKVLGEFVEGKTTNQLSIFNTT